MEGGFSKTTWDARDHGTKSGESLRRHYNAALEGIVADLYAPDFEFFGYPTSLARSGPSDLGLSMGEPN